MTKPKNSKILKKLLVSASAASLVLGAAVGAEAQTQVSQNGPSAIATAGDWNNGPFANTDKLQLGGAHNITLNMGEDLTIAALQLMTNGGQTLTVSDDNVYTFTTITNGGGGETANFAFGGTADGKSGLVFANTQARVKNIDFNDVDGTVTITKGDVAGTIDNTGGNVNRGTVVFNGTTTVTGAIGATKSLKEIQIGAAGDVTLGANAAATNTTIADGGNLNVGGHTLDGALDGAANGANGTLAVDGGAVTGVIGGTNALAAIEVGANGFTLANNATATNTTIAAGGTLDVADKTLTSNIDFANNASTVTIGNGGSVDGTIDSAGGVNGTLAVDGGAVTGDITNLAAIEVGANGFTLANNATATNTTIAAGGKLDVADKTLTSNVNFANNASTVTIGNGGSVDGTIKGDAANGGNTAGTLVVDGGTVTGAITNLAAIEVGAGGFTLANNATATNTTIADGGNLNVGAHTLTGALDGAANGGKAAGTLAVDGGAVTGVIGGTNALAAIEVGANGFTLANNATATNTTIAAGGTLNVADKALDSNVQFLGAGARYVSSNANNNLKTITTATKGEGIVHLKNAGNTTFQGTVGTSAARLAEFKWDDGNAQKLTTSGVSSIFATAIGGTNANSTFVVDHNTIIGGTVTNAVTTINDGISLTLSGQDFATTFNSTIDAANAGNGTLVLNGGDKGVTVGAAVGGNNALAAITVGAGTTTLNANATTANANGGTDKTTIADNARLNVANAITLDSNVELAGSGTIEFIDTGKLAAGRDLTAAKAGQGHVIYGDVNVGGNIGTANTQFASVQLGDSQIGAHGVYATTIKVTDSKTLTLNDVNSRLVGNVELVGSGALDITAVLKNPLAGDVTGATGTLTVGAGTYDKLGAGAISVGNLNLNVGGDVNRNLTASILTRIGENVNFTTGKTLDSKNIAIGNGHTLTMEAGSKLVATGVNGAGNGQGTLVLNDSITLPTIGSTNALAALNLNGASQTYKISGNHKATNVTLGNTNTLVLDNDAKLDGELTVQKSTLTLADHTLETTALTFADDAQINTNLTGGANIGHIDATKINGTDKTVTLEIGNADKIDSGKELVLFSKAGPKVNFTEKTQGGLNKFVYDQATGKITVIHDSAAAEENILKDKAILKNVSKENVKVLEELLATQTGEARQLVGALNRVVTNPDLTQAEKDAKELKIIHAVTETVQKQTAEATAGTAALVGTAVGIRTAAVGGGGGGAGTGGPGVSSGDNDHYTSGAWAQFLGSKATQKKTKKDSGYKSDTYGGIIGVDTMTSENTMIGFALANAEGKIKMKDQKLGDSTKTKTYLASIYGKHNLTDCISVRGNMMFANTKVNTREQKFTATESTMSQGRYDSQLASAEVAVGYTHRVNNMYVMPEVGLRASMFNDAGYTEKGEFFNRTITKRRGYNANALANLRAGTSHMYGDALFTPSIFVGVSHELGAKNPEVSTRLSGQKTPFTSKNKTLNKTLFNAGADLGVSYGRMDYSVGYEGTFADKFTSHGGTLKVRVNL